LDAETLGALPGLGLVSVLATGTNVVDLGAAQKCGITVCNVPNYSTPSVAQLTLALLLELTHHVGQHDQSVRAGNWSACPDFAYWETDLVELAGLELGIVGLGAIGQRVAAIATALGMQVSAATRTPRSLPGVKLVDLDALFQQADVVSLHCPLTDDTHHLVDRRRLATMKRSAFLINTSRGPLVDEAALAEALRADRIAGAAVDVLSREPPPAENPLLTAPRCIITPHLAWASRASRQRLLEQTVDNVRDYLAGEPVNVVSGA
jgi:glycerate dehydrogenase